MRNLVVIDYTNHRGLRSVRTIDPVKIWYGTNSFHEKPQWLLRAFDINKQADRDFALADIHSWEPFGGQPNPA